MFKLSYLINGQSKQDWYFPNKALCYWQRNQLKHTTHTFGTWKIEKT